MQDRYRSGPRAVSLARGRLTAHHSPLLDIILMRPSTRLRRLVVDWPPLPPASLRFVKRSASGICELVDDPTVSCRKLAPYRSCVVGLTVVSVRTWARNLVK